MVDDAELDRMMRDSLERRAGDVDVTAPVARNAAAAVRRRHRGWLASGFAAASVAAIVIVATVNSAPPPPRDPDDVPVPAMTDGPDTSDQWRTEYWRDIQVDVPDDWAWGVTPRISGHNLSFCGGVERGPYVGRPIMQSDLCITQASTPVPEDPYVWLDAKLPTGSVELGDGWVRQTIEVGSSTLSVGTNDARLRNRIIASARESVLCPSSFAQPPAPRRESTIEGRGRFREARFCAYKAGGGGFKLTYARPLTEVALEDTAGAVDEAPDSALRCKATSEFVVVSGIYEDPYSPDPELFLHHDLLFDMDCGHIAVGETFTGPRRLTEVTEDAVEPWATGGVRFIVCWGGTGWAHRYFLQGWC